MGDRTGALKSAATKTGLTLEEWEAKRQSGERWCYLCRRWKDGDGFATDRSRFGGKASLCKPCNSLRSRASRYGMSVEEVQAFIGAREGRCDICGRADQKMEIDHDHKTKKARGLLCSRCNGALGQFCDDVELLKKAIEYLETNNG